jgi:YbbR domain-containing protein
LTQERCATRCNSFSPGDREVGRVIRMLMGIDWRSWRQAIVRRVIHNWMLKLASIAFAVALWGFVNLGAREADRSLFVPIEFRNLPPQLVITNPIPDSVSVRLRGPRTILGTIDERRERILLDLANVGKGSTSFKIDGDMLNLPRGVQVTRLSPVQVTLDVDRIIERSLPVVANLAATAPAGYRVVDGEIRPASVMVSGPAAQVEGLRNVSAGTLHLRPTTGNFEETVALEHPADLVRLFPERVVVRGALEEVVTTRDFRNVEIGARNPPPQYRLRPRSEDVTVRGPQRLLREAKLSSENFYVDLDGLGAGYHAQRIESSVPDGLEVLEVRPPETTVEVPGEPTPRPTPARPKRTKETRSR